MPLGAANKVFIEMAPGALPYEGSVHFPGTDRSVRTASYQTRPLEREVLLAYFGGGFARELEERNELESFALDELAGIFGSEFRVAGASHRAFGMDARSLVARRVLRSASWLRAFA